MNIKDNIKENRIKLFHEDLKEILTGGNKDNYNPVDVYYFAYKFLKLYPKNLYLPKFRSENEGVIEIVLNLEDNTIWAYINLDEQVVYLAGLERGTDNKWMYRFYIDIEEKFESFVELVSECMKSSYVDEIKIKGE